MGREFVENVARVRRNVVPYIADARDAEKFASFGKVDVVYCDVAQQDQTEIAMENCRRNLKNGGRLLLVVKSRSIDVLKEPRDVFRQEGERLAGAGFLVEKIIELSPFDKDHALISAVFVGLGEEGRREDPVPGLPAPPREWREGPFPLHPAP